MTAALDDVRRVIASGGRLVAELVHPDNWILAGAEGMGGNIRRIRRQDDFRTNETLFVFPDVAAVEAAFAARFRDVRVGVNRVEYFSRTRVNYIVTGVA
jgi:hypothetical protein